MLPESVLSHPYYHPELDEISAKEILTYSHDGNFLFCRGATANDIYLVYKAEFRSNMEVRSVIMSHREQNDSLIDCHTLYIKSIGWYANLYSITQGLVQFLQGWTSSPFVPKAIFRTNSLTPQEAQELENQYIAEDNYQQEITKQQQDQVQYIFDTIHEKTPPEPEGENNPEKMLNYDGYMISSPQQYASGRIICHLHTPSCAEGAWVFIGRKNIDLLGSSSGSSIFKEAHLLDKLVEVCAHGDCELAPRSGPGF